MTSATQIVGPGGGGGPGFGVASIFRPPSIRDDQREDERGAPRLPGRNDAAGEADSLPGRAPPLQGQDARAASDVVRLPGQEGASEGGPRRPLIAGGAFTLAVAIGLSLDQQNQPDSLQRSTPSSLGEDAAANGSDEAGETGIDGLTEEERELVQELQQRDAEVRRHEAAHAAAGGQYAGSPTFTYQTGPDGKRYAVGGEVSIDTSPVRGDPEATIRKAQQIRAAANAPADPSPQDRRVAAQADSLRQQAQAELAAQRREERQAEEAEAEAAEAERAARQGTSGTGAQPPAQAAGVLSPAGQTVSQRGDAGGEGVVAAAAFSPGESDTGSSPVSEPLVGAEAGGRAEARNPGPSDISPPFAPSAFSGAAASYRGASQTPRLVSIAV